MRSPSRKTIALAALPATALLFAPAITAQGGIAQKGPPRVSFTGQIAPAKLPRTDPAPVSVQMGGKITTTDKSTPPKLEQILLAINADGKVQAKGLPTCPVSKLESISSAGAQAACAGALIGHGT